MRNNAKQIRNASCTIASFRETDPPLAISLRGSNEPYAEYGLHFGDSSMIIGLSVPSPDGISKESIGFFYVPLLEKDFSVIDTTLRDSVHVRASYVLLNSHDGVVQYHLWLSDDEENYLKIESYNPQTKESEMSFSVLFESRHPGSYPNWNHAFTEGKICTVLE